MSLIPSKKMTTRTQKSHHKPDWDSTINDLSELRATPEEIKRRQEVHRSKNLEYIRKSAIEKRLEVNNRSSVLSDRTNLAGNAFLKEILYNSTDAHRLLDDANRAIQVARDVFADDSKKYKAVPAVTSVDSDEENALYIRHVQPDGLIKSANGSQTALEKLSESVVKRPALNEATDSSEDSDAESGMDADSGSDTPIPCPPRLDLQRFQKLLELEELSTIDNASANQDDSGIQTKPSNRTMKQNNKTRLQHPHEPRATDLKSILTQLVQRLDEYDLKHLQSGKSKSEGSEKYDSISNYTTTLVAVLNRMMEYFNQIQLELYEERHQRSLRERQLLELSNRTDLLTSELIQTQEQFQMVLDELNRVRDVQRQEIKDLQDTVARISKGQTVHNVTVTKPNHLSSSTKNHQKSAAPGMVLHKSPAPVIVHTHEEFQKSPENEKLLAKANHGSLLAPSEEYCNDTQDPMDIEHRIEQLKEDHKATLEKFKKLGLEMHMGGIKGHSMT